MILGAERTIPEVLPSLHRYHFTGVCCTQSDAAETSERVADHWKKWKCFDLLCVLQGQEAVLAAGFTSIHVAPWHTKQ